MATVTVNDSNLYDIADSIRAKLGVQTTYKPSQMADAIDSISGGGITPTGTKSITANGTYDVTTYASAEVDVPTGSTPVINSLSVTENGTYTAPTGVDGYSPITVSVSGGGVDNIKYTRYTLTGDTTLQALLNAINYEVSTPDGFAVYIRASGDVAPSTGNNTRNNYIFIKLINDNVWRKHYYKGRGQTPNSFPDLPTTNESNSNLIIQDGILADNSVNPTTCLGTTGDVVTIAEIAILPDNTKMNGGAL